MIAKSIWRTWEGGNVKKSERSGRNNSAAVSSAAQLESVEARRMLSADVSHGVLTIEGTRRADTIVLTMDSTKTLRVRIGNTESTFLKKSFSKIRINGGFGDDLITIGSDQKPISIQTSISGGDGSDTLIGGAGNDTVSGGSGADLIAGAGGNDEINGDNGADDLHGGDGRDSVCGGRGDDQLHDDAGRDSIYGNAGNDLIYFHDDVMQFRDHGKREQAFAEPQIHNAISANPNLTINQTQLNTIDGDHVPGGLVTTGGSTFIVSGAGLGQWSGLGLNATATPVPHFDLPGNPGSVANGSLTITGGSTINLNQLPPTLTLQGAGNINLNQGGILIGGSFGSPVSPVTNIPGGTLSITQTVAQPLTLPAGTVILNLSDGSTRTLQSGQTLTVVGPASVQRPAGTPFQVSSGNTIQITAILAQDDPPSDVPANDDNAADNTSTDDQTSDTGAATNPESNDDNPPADGLIEPPADGLIAPPADGLTQPPVAANEPNMLL